MKEKLDILEDHLAELLGDTQEIAHLIDRGPGGRNMALCITKLEEAQDRLRRAKLDILISEEES